ncbi:hypothetical protein D3C81_305110 [compost metagenome]
MRQGQDQRGERLTDDEAIFALVLGIVKLAPQHDRYQFGGFQLEYAEQDNAIELKLFSPKNELMYQADVTLETHGEDTKAYVYGQWPCSNPGRADVKEARVALRKMVLAVVHHDYAETRCAGDTVTHVARFI